MAFGTRNDAFFYFFLTFLIFILFSAIARNPLYFSAAIQEKVPQHPDDLEWESSEEEDQPLTTKNKQSRKRKSKTLTLISKKSRKNDSSIKDASEAPSQKIKVKDKGKKKITLSEQILLKKHDQPKLMQDAMQSSLKGKETRGEEEQVDSSHFESFNFDKEESIPNNPLSPLVQEQNKEIVNISYDVSKETAQDTLHMIENLDTSANRGCNPSRTSIAEQEASSKGETLQYTFKGVTSKHVEVINIPSIETLSMIPPMLVVDRPPSTSFDFNLTNFFLDDEENKKDDFFEILKNWSSGPSLERKLVESSSQDLEDKLSAFRQRAYVNNLDEALNDPNFKLEIEKVVNDLNNISDLPSKVATELQDFVRILTSASKLRLKTLGIKEEINQIEINTSEDRNKLLQMKEDLTSLRLKSKSNPTLLEELNKREEYVVQFIETLQKELSSIQARKKKFQDQKKEVISRQNQIKEEGKTISMNLTKAIEHKRKLESLYISECNSLEKEYQAYHLLKKKHRKE